MSGPLVIAHRGSRAGGAFENTVRAFRDAIAAGADGVELDVRSTRDGRLVVFHDAETTLPGGRRVRVRDATLDDLRDGSVEAHDRVTSLEEVLRALLGRTGVVVEIKEPGTEDRVVAAVRSMKADARLPWLVLASFHPEVVRSLARSAPDLRRGLVVSPRGPGFAGWLRGRMPASAWRSSGADDLLPHASLVSAGLVQRVTAQHGRVLPWTVDDAAAAARMAELGCAAVITDDVAAVRSR